MDYPKFLVSNQRKNPLVYKGLNKHAKGHKLIVNHVLWQTVKTHQMQHKASLHQGLHCLLRFKTIFIIKRYMTSNPVKYKMDNSIFIVSICMGYSIRMKRINNTHAHFFFSCNRLLKQTTLTPPLLVHGLDAGKLQITTSTQMHLLQPRRVLLTNHFPWI